MELSETTIRENRQKCFDIVYKYYRDGGVPGFTRNEKDPAIPNCRYFIPSTKGMCGIGALLKGSGIPIEEIPDIENYNSLAGKFCIMVDDFSEEDSRFRVPDFILNVDKEDSTYGRTFLLRLQRVHDFASQSFKEKGNKALLEGYEKFAGRYQLTIPEEN